MLDHNLHNQTKMEISEWMYRMDYCKRMKWHPGNQHLWGLAGVAYGNQKENKQ